MIAHIDLYAFFARCEKLRNPELEEKPVVICVYTREETSGAVSTSNYKARKLGIGSGMPLSEARQKATEETVFLPVDHEYYREKSKEVMSAVRSFSREVQKTSIDEAYFRVKEDPESRSRKIKSRVESLGLTASIGIAPNKFLAKLASEEDKPDGLEIVREEEVEEFLSGREVGELHGVGSKTEKKLRRINVRTVEDLRELNNSVLVEKFGRSKAASLKQKARGKGSKDLETDERKQISRIKTMARNSGSKSYIMKELETIADQLYTRAEKKDLAFRKIKLLTIDSKLEHVTRSKKINTSNSRGRILSEVENLLEKLLEQKEDEIRRVGIALSDFVDTGKQQSLESF